MDLDHRFRPSSGGLGGRIILLGDGTEISTEAPDSEMFDHDDEDKDLDAQVDKFQSEGSPSASNGNARNAREETPGPASQAKPSQEPTDSPSSVKTEKSESAENKTAEKDTRIPEKVAVDASEK